MFSTSGNRAPGKVDPKFRIRDFEPAYVKIFRQQELPAHIETAIAELEDCCVCPRNCHVNRLLDKAKVCNTGRHAVSRVHSPISVRKIACAAVRVPEPFSLAAATCAACFARIGIYRSR